MRTHKAKIKENKEKIKLNKQLPYLVATVVEILDPEAEEVCVTGVTRQLPSSPLSPLSFFCARSAGRR